MNSLKTISFRLATPDAVPFMTRFGAMIRTMRLVILVLVGLALGLPAAAAEGESGPYPIWWSPSLELDSLDRIDARLQRPLWRRHIEDRARRWWRPEADRPDSGFTVTVIEDSGEREDFAGSCAGILRIERGPPFDLVHVELRTWFHQSAQCRALVRLKEAAPARRSFVRDFVLSEAAIDVLPAVIDPDSSCGGGGGLRAIPGKQGAYVLARVPG